MATNFLDKTGVGYLWAKVKEIFALKTEIPTTYVETLKVNDVEQTLTDKTVNITVPTDNASLANGAGYQTAAEVSSAIATAVGEITSFEFEIVTELPATGNKGVIYLIAHAHGEGDGYDEYMYINGAFEKVGHTDIDLSGYVMTSDLQAITTAEIDEIVAAS